MDAISQLKLNLAKAEKSLKQVEKVASNFRMKNVFLTEVVEQRGVELRQYREDIHRMHIQIAKQK